jgi:hypothetical protein
MFFSGNGDNMPFSDFFSLIGVSDYEYDSEEWLHARGVRF